MTGCCGGRNKKTKCISLPFYRFKTSATNVTVNPPPPQVTVVLQPLTMVNALGAVQVDGYFSLRVVNVATTGQTTVSFRLPPACQINFPSLPVKLAIALGLVSVQCAPARCATKPVGTGKIPPAITLGTGGWAILSNFDDSRPQQVAVAASPSPGQISFTFKSPIAPGFYAVPFSFSFTPDFSLLREQILSGKGPCDGLSGCFRHCFCTSASPGASSCLK